MSPAAAPSPNTAEPDADRLTCVHCDEPIRPCEGEAELHKWQYAHRVSTGDGCQFADHVHAEGERAGSHLCGKDTRVATPAPARGGRR